MSGRPAGACAVRRARSEVVAQLSVTAVGKKRDLPNNLRDEFYDAIRALGRRWIPHATSSVLFETERLGFSGHERLFRAQMTPRLSSQRRAPST